MPSADMKFMAADYAEEWHFFNHGALFAFAGLTTDPVADWFAQQPEGMEVLMQPYKRELFEGLAGDNAVQALSPRGVPWSNVLCAVRKEFWESLWLTVGGVAVVDRPAQVYSQVFSGDIEMLDPGEVERHTILQPGVRTITVTVFCVDGNKARWEIRPAASAAGVPRFVQVPPRPEVVSMGRAVLSGDLEHLQHKDNPAFQPLLDKFKSIVTGGNQHEGGSNHTNGS